MVSPCSDQEDKDAHDVCPTVEDQEQQDSALQSGATETNSSAADCVPGPAPKPRRRRRTAGVNDSTATTQEEQSGSGSDEQLNIGKNYLVKRNDNEWYPAEIIERRPVENWKMACSGKYEYFIHYENHDRRLDEWVPRSRIMVVPHAAESQKLNFDYEDRKMTRNQTKKRDELLHAHDSSDEDKKDPKLAELEREHEDMTKVKYIEKIQFGKYEVDTWYFSPYPGKYGKVRQLYICEFCLKYTYSLGSYKHHLGECKHRHPPGKKIYHKEIVSIWEVDGVKSKLYCQNLCLLCKLFLDHKTVCYDVNSFLFYVLCEVDQQGHHIVGYFSKEKESEEGNNLACILTLPMHQKKGYGKLLIAFSYELSKLEGKVGSPEKPLSDLGILSYRSYWTWVLLGILRSYTGTITIERISEMTSIAPEDIVSTLQALDMVKYWKEEDVICITSKDVEECIQKTGQKNPMHVIDPKCLKWTPPIFK